MIGSRVFNNFQNAVGDGANDLCMLHRAGTGVALHAKPSVAEQCDIPINFGDLTSLLFIQGYTKEDFVFNPPSDHQRRVVVVLAV